MSLKKVSYHVKSEVGKKGKIQFPSRIHDIGRKGKNTYLPTTKKTGG
jgi:hypothetical protein